MSNATLTAPPVWDLTRLYAGREDPAIEATWTALGERVGAFEQAYRGKVADGALSPTELATAIREYEAIACDAAKPATYASLLFAADTLDPANGAFMQRSSERATELSVRLTFFEIELQAIPEEAMQRLLADDALANYRHYLRLVRLAKPFTLSEKEEVIASELATTGRRAWVRFFTETTSRQRFRLPGSDQELTQAEVIALLRDPVRETRAAAAEAFTKGLIESSPSVQFAFNTILNDKAIRDRLRGYPTPERERHLENELDDETVDMVMTMCRDHYELVARYYRTKRAILGLEELTHIDRYAPLQPTEEKVDWERAKAMVLEAFATFSPDMARAAAEFFDQNWIDAAPRPGKRGGAFCSYITPDLHPVILMTYLDRMDDVGTLAHELGHGVHASVSRGQSYFNFMGTLPLAEVASTFGEMLVFERMTENAKDRDRLALYAEKIEGSFATIFRQAAMYRFEQRCHRARRDQGELTMDQISDLWQEELQAMFGDSVALGEDHRLWWSYVSHFFAVPFYVYAYSFGELLVLALYQMAKEEGPSFAPKYLDLLRLGGSQSPEDLMRSVGVDLKDPSFWQGGFAVLTRLVDSFEAQWAELSAEPR